MTQHFVREDARAYLDLMATMERPPLSEELVLMMRDLPADYLAQLDLPVGELGEVRDVVMPGPGGDLALRLFDVRASRGPGPVVVFFHGGGFILGSIDTHAGLTAEISRRLDLPVISVEYRLAPEHPWPAAVDDAEAAARWIAGNGAAFEREFTGLLPIGDSAGGSLAAVCTAALRDAPASLPAIMQVLIYPTADFSTRYPSADLFGQGYGLDDEDKAVMVRAYAPDVCDPRGSALLGDLGGMPPTMVITAATDPLRDQGRAYAAKAIQAGVDVMYREVPGMIHGFFSYRQAIPSAQADVASTLHTIKAMLDDLDTRPSASHRVL